MKTSKSPKRVLTEALAVAEVSLPAYSHRFSPKKFTLHQLFACLVLKDFYNLTYRGTVGLLAEVVNARNYWRRCRLLLLKVLTHNISILRRQIGLGWTPLVGRQIRLNRVKLAARETPIGLARPLQLFNLLMC